MQKAEGKKPKLSKDVQQSEPRAYLGEHWSIHSIFLAAFLMRVLLVFYGRIHDYFFEVSFTDVDYKVFSDAARHVYDGNSPFLRRTYRYTPILAWLLLPNINWPEFGKLLFCSLDILVGWLCYKLSLKGKSRLGDAAVEKVLSDRARDCVIIFWLVNPLTAVISSRGNADVLVCAAVICSLYLVLAEKWVVAAVVHGFAIHLKLYPVIYLPSIFMLFSNVSYNSPPVEYCKKLFLNAKGYAFALLSLGSFAVASYLCYASYGQPYLDEALLYHVTRTDIRHNFSPYFYLLYLSSNDLGLSRLVGIGAFLPQAALILYFALKYYKDLPFCWLLTTIAFVTFNKVCTSQYFIWYICLLPVAQTSIQMKRGRAAGLILLWFLGQGLWLYPAYLFEFKGYNTFTFMWLASLVFLVVNSYIIIQLCCHHSARNLPLRESEKKNQ